eukprot:TRINITY_DN13581_c0_g1_i4.p2 TRINITY_DN13581_c0_g1~~TRINITY_DN13581_c0_g1_i4.p2  ORF type:complete len:239 (-),score=45.47 TRINITY_DN13581_c0_g1_i4:39-755(-)
MSQAVNIAPHKAYIPGKRFMLTKGETIDFTATCVRAGLGWDMAKNLPFELDLDASVLLLDHSGQVVYTVYWGQLVYPGVQHHGDNLTGKGEGDDEQITLDLTQLGANIVTVLFVVNIYNKTNSPVNFGMVDNEFCRLVDMSRGCEMCRYVLDDMAHVNESNTLLMCKLFRAAANNNLWRMQALGVPLSGPSTAVELSRTGLLEPLSYKLPVFSPVPAPAKKEKKPKTKKGGGECCVIA